VKSETFVSRFIYNLLWPIGLVFFLPGYLRKMVRRGGYRKNFGQRLAIYSGDVIAGLSRHTPTWLHAVSVGEVNVALKLANALRALEPDLYCVLTTTTTTGFALANKNAPSWIQVLYAPLDYWPIMRRAFAVIRPARILLVEAEVWPNLVAFAHARRIPVALVNARLSPRSEKEFRRFKFLVAPVFRLLNLVCVPELEDVERWKALGISADRIRVTGSIKFDPASVGPVAGVQSPGDDATKPLAEASTNGLEYPVLFGGSTHRGEEEILARVFLRLRRQFPTLRLFIAPRHVERLREIRSRLDSLHLRVALTTQIGSQFGDADCVILDTTGELHRWYAVATVVFIGKSLTARGGQNPVEPILAGKPVVFGPHMENFAALAMALVSGQGALQVRDFDSLERAMEELLRDEELRRHLVENARRVLNQHRGAAERTAALVHKL